MSSTYVPALLRRRVQQRAAGNCEYCLLSEDDAYFSHEPDHIIAEKHGGETSYENVTWACFDCNRFKGSDIASRDPLSGDLVSLFNLSRIPSNVTSPLFPIILRERIGAPLGRMVPLIIGAL